MSETAQDYQTAPLSALDDLVHQRHRDRALAVRANQVMYQQLLTETASLLHGSEPMTQSALVQVCIEHNAAPVETLELVFDFLATFQAYQQVQVPEQEVAEPESPYLGRDA